MFGGCLLTCVCELVTHANPYGILSLNVSRRPGPAGLEDGTPPFTSIAAARHGFAFLGRLASFSASSASSACNHCNPQSPSSCGEGRHGGCWGHAVPKVALRDVLAAVSAHCQSLTAWLVQRLRGLRHGNGLPVAEVYGHEGSSKGGWGPVVAFNLRRADGSWVGCNEVRVCVCMRALACAVVCIVSLLHRPKVKNWGFKGKGVGIGGVQRQACLCPLLRVQGQEPNTGAVQCGVWGDPELINQAAIRPCRALGMGGVCAMPLFVCVKLSTACVRTCSTDTCIRLPRVSMVGRSL